MSEGRIIGTVLDLFLIMDMTYVLCRRQLSASLFGMTYTSDRRSRTSRRIGRHVKRGRPTARCVADVTALTVGSKDVNSHYVIP